MADQFLAPSCNLTLKELVRHYHSIRPKIKYKEILSIIATLHGRRVTMDMLKKICKQEQLNRQKNVSDNELREVVALELETSLSNVGYRQMTESITTKYRINVSKENVRRALKSVDPQGVQARKRNCIKRRIYWSNGPGEIYHIDGNDKLKRWGFCIHGCIDGFSRKILWLYVASSNSDPLIIGNFYLKCLETFHMAPTTLRMDKGRENIYCEDIQVFLTGNNASYIYAASTRNQRIEALWSRLKKFRTTWWIGFFSDLVRSGLYRPHLYTHRECLLYCFLPIIQAELNDFMHTWNLRHVRQSSHAPGGKPNLLFHVPEIVGYKQKGIPVSDIDLNIAKNVLGITSHPTYLDNDLHELLECYVHINNIKVAQSAEGGLNIYTSLLHCLSNDHFIV